MASRVFDGLVLAAGLAVFAGVCGWTVREGSHVYAVALLSIPLIVLIARFPLLLDGGGGGLQVGFDSCVLMFLLCASPLPLPQALAAWSLGVLATQLTSGGRPESKRFNIGVGIVGGAGATLTLAFVRGNAFGTPRELLGVALAAVCYFATDYVLSAISVALEERTSLREQLIQASTPIAIMCFVPFDSLGYLAAVVSRHTPWWTWSLLAVPLATLLVATRAVTRGREHARRLSVLFDAAVHMQALTAVEEVVKGLAEWAGRLLRLRQVEVRLSAPSTDEVGAPVRDEDRQLWVVAPSHLRARSTREADQAALDALAAVSSDALARLRLTESMTHLARHDVLTNLPNRALLLDRTEHALQMARLRGTRVALLFCDLDGFKPVNDRFGHAAGDEVLVDVAQRLTASVRRTDTVARLGGDEFAILLEEVHAAEVDSTCERLLAALGTGAMVAGHHVSLSASIGVALDDTAGSAAELLRNADVAMYQAKARGKNQYLTYHRSLGNTRVRRLELLESLHAAIGEGDFRLVYQPVVEVGTGRISGVEVLARWCSNGEDVSPEVFIRAAEDSGLIVPLGELVLELATRDAAELQEAAGGSLSLGVNISAQQLRDPGFVDKVKAAMARMPGVELVLEITERCVISDDSVSAEAMARLVAAGATFAIDDFGVGFSSIGYLQHLPVRILKTDASFSAGIDEEERSCRLLHSIAMMGQALGLDVVVEGIERRSQLEHLRDHVGATYAQGFLLHRPMPLAEITQVLARGAAGREPAAEVPQAG
ncbi:MAG: putative bifunctional diguanylate cyclase/phosphodiesterase [Nocardioidaceae bacterium]